MGRKLRPAVLDLVASVLDALTVPFAELPSEYEHREDVLNGRVQEVKATLVALIEDPRTNPTGAAAELRELVADYPVTYRPYSRVTDEDWEQQ